MVFMATISYDKLEGLQTSLTLNNKMVFGQCQFSTDVLQVVGIASNRAVKVIHCKYTKI